MNTVIVLFPVYLVFSVETTADYFSISYNAFD